MELKNQKIWPKVLTPEQVAEYLQLPLDEVRTLLLSKQIPAVKIGDQWRILLSGLDQWLNLQMLPRRAELNSPKNLDSIPVVSQIGQEAQTSTSLHESNLFKPADSQTSTKSITDQKLETPSLKSVSPLTAKVTDGVKEISESTAKSKSGKTPGKDQKTGRRKGIVYSYYPDRGYGYIKDEESRKVFVEALDIEGFGTSMQVNDVVEFSMENRYSKGWVAKNVKILPKPIKSEKSSSISMKPKISYPSKSRHWERLYKDALAAREQGDITKARRLFEESLKAGGATKNVFEAYAAMEKKQGDPRGINELPKEGTLYEIYGMLLKQNRDLIHAVEVLRAGLRNAPKHAKALHWALANILVELGGEANLLEAVKHAEEAKKSGMYLKDDPRYLKLKAFAKPITREALSFFQRAGFRIDLKVESDPNPNPKFVDLFISSDQIEYKETYNLTDKIRVRCFFYTINNNDIETLLKTIRFPHPKIKINNDVGFLILNDTTPYLDLLGSISEKNPVGLVPIDRKILLRRISKDDITMLFRQLLDQWLGKRDLFDTRAPVRGRRFFGRTEELLNLIRNIEDGQSVAIYGLRKTGKTSLLYQITEKRPRDFVIYFDLQEITVKNCAYLYWQIVHSLQEMIIEKEEDSGFIQNNLKLSLGSVEKYSDLIKPEENNALLFDEDISQLLKSLATNEMTASSKIIIAIDELELMLPIRSQGFKGYDDFFRHIRGIAQRTQGKLVCVVAAANATINEQATWEGLDNPMFQFFKQMFLPLLKETECKEMIEQLGRGMGVSFDLGSLDYIYSETGGHPYITRQLCSHIVHNKPRPLKVNQELVISHIDSFISEKYDVFREIIDRLDKFFPEEKNLLLAISRGISNKSELARLIDTSADRALWHLMGYQIIECHNEVYQIKIHLLHRWFSKYYAENQS